MHIKTELELILLPRFSTESCFKHAKTTVFLVLWAQSEGIMFQNVDSFRLVSFRDLE